MAMVAATADCLFAQDPPRIHLPWLQSSAEPDNFHLKFHCISVYRVQRCMFVLWISLVRFACRLGSNGVYIYNLTEISGA